MISSTLPQDYRQNAEIFTEFYALQGEYAAALALHPRLIRAWLDARPRAVRSAADHDGPSASQNWRTARVSNRRRRELTQRLDSGESAPELAQWLRGCLPVLSLLEIGDGAGPHFAELNPQTVSTGARLSAMREGVFLANYGLAKSAAARGSAEGYDDRLSAACVGLLDAVDRYVPGAQAARFSYFAGYWIRYHLGRQGQKFNGVISFPIYQQRMGRRLAQLERQRHGQGLAEASPAEICAALAVGIDAISRHRQRPTIVSLDAAAVEGEPETSFEHLLCDPAPEPWAEYEQRDLAHRIQSWLRRCLPPATRVMLAYAHEVGALPDAAEEYLEQLREIAGERLSFLPK